MTEEPPENAQSRDPYSRIEELEHQVHELTGLVERMLDADEPAITAGRDSAPNSVEYVLHALATCLTGTLVSHAAVRGIEIEAVESSYTGDMDVRGLLGLADDVRKGFNKVTVNIRVKSEASAEQLTELALYSPVYDMVSRSLPVEFTLTTY